MKYMVLIINKVSINFMLRGVLGVSFVLQIVALEPITIGAIGIGTTSASIAYYRPYPYYKGNLEVCKGGNTNYGANPWLGLTTCAMPSFRVTLNKKERFKETLESITSDNKHLRITIDAVVVSPNLEDVQLRLVEDFYMDDMPFKDAILSVPLRNCIQTHISQKTAEAHLTDKTPNKTFIELIRTCMIEYDTTFEPTKNTFITIQRG